MAIESSPVSRATPERVAKRRRIGPGVALLLLAPLISEVLYGSTRVSFLVVIVPQILIWGCGALLIREFVRRRRKGWQSILLLGLALAMAEECVIQQTSIAPLVGLAPHEYGRVWGVNWVYLLWALGYWSVWTVLIPIQLTELLFRDRRERCWLRARGIVMASIAFVVGSFMAWYAWTQRARVMIFHMPKYSPALIYLAGGVAVILLLVLAAYALPAPANRDTVSTAPTPRLVGVAAFVLGVPWGAFILFGFGFFSSVPFPPVLGIAAAWAGATFFVMRRWIGTSDWSDMHRYALVLGGVLACMAAGFVVYEFTGARRVDWIAKAALNVAAAAWLLVEKAALGNQLKQAA